MILGDINKIKKFDLNELGKMIGIKFDDIVDYDFLLLLSDYKVKYGIDIGFYLDKDNKTFLLSYPIY